MSRGFETIQNLFKDGFAQAVYVSDCLAAQLKNPAKLHQIYLAHLLRELNNFIDVFNCQWSINLKAVLMQIIELKKSLVNEDYSKENESVKKLEEQLDNLLQTNMDKAHPKKQVSNFYLFVPSKSSSR